MVYTNSNIVSVLIPSPKKIAEGSGAVVSSSTDVEESPSSIENCSSLYERDRNRDHLSDGYGAANSASDEETSASAIPMPSPVKPTCRVPPYKEQGTVTMPGYTGLRNIGNTCFMNAVLQALINTRELKDYFLHKLHYIDVNQTNPLGMKGQLAMVFGDFMADMWSGMKVVHEPSNLKKLIGQKATQFANYAQHDAQEFLTFLLDGLHEDLNRVQTKGPTETIESDGLPDEVVAEKSWRNHLARDDSIIVDLFHGQLKSHLRCPECFRESVTFDPFVSLPVPFPKTHRLISLYFWYTDPYKKPLKCSFRIPDDAMVIDLLVEVGLKFSVPPDCLVMMEVSEGRLVQRFRPQEPVSTIAVKDVIFVFQLLDPNETREDILNLIVIQRQFCGRAVSCSKQCHKCGGIFLNLRHCRRCWGVAYCSAECKEQDSDVHRISCRPPPLSLVGQPFVVSVPKSVATYNRLMLMMEARSSFSVNVFQPPVVDGLRRSSSSDSLCDAAADKCSDENVELMVCSPLRSPCNRPGVIIMELDDNGDADVEDAVTTQPIEILPPEDDEEEEEDEIPPVKEEQDDDSPKPAVYPSPCRQVQLVIGNPQQTPRSMPLFCFSIGDAVGNTNDSGWFQDQGDEPLPLSNCKYLVMDWCNRKDNREFLMVESKIDIDCDEEKEPPSDTATKTLSDLLACFTETEILSPEESWFCVRCKKHQQASKSLMLWKLPPILIIQMKRFQYTSQVLRRKIDTAVDYPVRNLDLRPYVCAEAPEQETKYDLYAVVCHSGSTYFGHYVALAALLSDGQDKPELDWRRFNDSNVVNVQRESEVVDSEAYLLFYRRRDCASLNLVEKYKTLQESFLSSGKQKLIENMQFLDHDETVSEPQSSSSSQLSPGRVSQFDDPIGPTNRTEENE